MTARSAPQVTGTRKAAVLMALMGEDAASAIYPHLAEEDVQLLTKELAEIGKISTEVAQQILQEYHEVTVTEDYLAQGGPEFATRLLKKAFGEERAKGLLQRVVRLQQLSAGQLESLQKADPQQLAKFLEDEHPQTIALILAHLDGKQASTLLMKLPEKYRAESVKRLAQLRQFSPEMAEKVSVVLHRRLQSLGEKSRKTYAGCESVADVMNRLEPGEAKAVLESIERDDAKLAIKIRNLMFTFEDLIGVSEASIREWSGSMDKKAMAMALKGASDDLKNHIFRTMSSRAVEMLKEDMEVLGPVRSKDVAAAQQEAVTLIRKLEAEGKVVLRAEGDDEYVV